MDFNLKLKFGYVRWREREGRLEEARRRKKKKKREKSENINLKEQRKSS